jgi:hypothetical protein
MLMSKLDRIHGHFRRYQKPELEVIVNETGVEILQCSYFDVFGTLPWFILNTVFQRTGFSPALVRINDRIFIPLSRAIEQAIKPPFGKNLILVARKRA